MTNLASDENVPNENSGNFYTGTEPFLAPFTQTQVVLSGIRLVHDGKVTHQVSDLGAQIENVRRTFIHSGDIVSVLQDISRVNAAFNQRVSGWEAEANRRLKAKSQLSGGALAKMKTEQSGVRTKIRLGLRSLTKLEVELHQLAGSLAAEEEDGLDGETPSNVKPEAIEIAESQPELSPQQEEEASKVAVIVDEFLAGMIDPSLVVSVENADRADSNDADHVEQVLESKDSSSELPLIFAAGWTIKSPPAHLNEQATGRRKLDLLFWLIPKSLECSNSLCRIDGRNEIWVESRKLDSTRIAFTIADEGELPSSDLLAGFLRKFKQKYDEAPAVLVAQLGNLEWIQKSVLVTSKEK